MYMITIDDILFILFVLFLFFLGVVGTFWPIHIAKIVTLGPKLIFPKLFGERNIPSRALKAIRLIDDPEVYADEFKGQLAFIRVLGIGALSMLCCISTLFISALSSQPGM